ncbi:MAG TPA: ATP-binding protein [Gaiellaceae bacterium]
MNWLDKHKQRLLYGLAAASLAVAIGAAAIGGFLLHRAADVERQALRTQELAGAATQLHAFWLRLEAEGATTQLAASRDRVLDVTSAAFAAVRAYDRAESDRIRPAYLTYVDQSTSGFNRAIGSNGLPSPAEEGRVDRDFTRLESAVAAESRRLARATRVANPQAKRALIGAAAAAALLVALLIWQFELQRRAGRIDRDNAARSDELSRLRQEFVAAVSHELRTPLTSIIGYLDLVSENVTGNLTSEQETFLAIVERNADRLQELVGDLLLIAETDGGALALDLRETDLDALTTDRVESARPSADAREIQLTLSLGATRHIQGDPFRLGQMMDNLVSNAIKFTPMGGRVVVRTAFEDGHALFEVTDSGPGISPADQVRLFDRFFRARAAVDQAVRGTGLGLAIAKAIVDAHHGSITVESTVGTYATFRVELPETQAGRERGS